MLHDETLSKKFLTKGLRIYIFTLLTAPIGYLIKLIISNTLSVEDVGVLYSVIGLIIIIGTYHDFGLTESLNFFLPKYRIEKKHNYFKTAIFINILVQIILGIAIAAGLYFLSDYLAVNYFKSESAKIVIQLFCIYFAFINIFNVIMNIFNAFQDVISNKSVELVRLGGTLLVIIFFWMAGQGSLFNYSIGRIIGPIISIILALIIFYFRYKFVFSTGKVVYDKDMYKEYITYSLWVLVGTNAGMLLGQIDQQMIVYFLGPTQAGFYTNFLTLSQIYYLITTPLLIFLYPVITELISKQQHDKIKIIQNIFYKYFSLIAVCIGGIFLVLGPVFAIILFGKKFEYSGVILQYNALFLIFNILLQINFTILAGIGSIKQRVKILGIACLVNFIINLILIPVIATPGAVIGTIIGRIIMFYMSFRVINQKEKIDFDWNFFIKNLIIVCTITLIVFWFKNDIFVMEDSHRLSNLIYFLGVGLVYIGALGIFNTHEIKLLLNEIKINFKK